MAPQHKITQYVAKPKQEKLIVEIMNGRPMLQVANEVGVSDSSVKRWFETFPEDEKIRLMARHIEQRKLEETEHAVAVVSGLGDDVVKDFKWVLHELRRILTEAKDDEDRVLQLGTLRETHKVLNSLANIFGLVSKKVDVQIDINNSPAVLEIREVILRVLENHPEAQGDFLAEMHKLKVISDARSAG